MLRVLCASTFEIDDSEAAVNDILAQLDEDQLLAHSVGIIGCNLDYILNKTIKTLAEKLPFDIVGSTTTISGIPGESGEDQLSLFVLTSDTLSFACSSSEPLTENIQQSIADACSSAASKLTGEPSMAIVFGPYLYQMTASADEQVRALDKALNGLPLFGSISLDYIDSVRDPRTFYNGTDSSDCMSLLLISGEVDPEFRFIAIPESHFLKQKAIITSSEGNILKEVNNMPAITYLESLGFLKEGVLDSIPSIPLSIDIGDGGKPVARAFLAASPEGYIICGGDMPEKASLGVGSLDSLDVQSTASQLGHEIVNSGKDTGVIIVSCLSRNIALGFETMLEIEEIESTLGNDIPYLVMYSAGEIFPEMMEDKALNKAHNFTMIACAF